MPVTFRPFEVEERTVDERHFKNDSQYSASSVLRQTVKSDLGASIDQIMQSSFPLQPTENSEPRIKGCTDGFVHTVINAYNGHHALEFRPDDVWLTILTQFNFFVNGDGRAEALRHKFVAHRGQKSLKVNAGFETDMGVLVQKMSDLVQDHVVDPSLRAWMMPSFETTTDTDRIAASIIMMATLRSYFSYKFQFCCGIPKVTILGCKADWESILHRIERLKQYGPEMSAWCALLYPDLSRFVKTFDDGVAESRENREFWRRVCHANGGSGVSWLSGWITAFCMFDEKGNWLGHDLNHAGTFFRQSSRVIQSVTHSVRKKLPWNTASSVCWSRPHRGASLFHHPKPRRTLILDGVWYPSIDNANIPPAHAEVPIIIDVAGQTSEAFMVAGVIGTKVAREQSGGQGELLSPVVGWWVFTKKLTRDELLSELKRVVCEAESKAST